MRKNQLDLEKVLNQQDYDKFEALTILYRIQKPSNGQKVNWNIECSKALEECFEDSGIIYRINYIPTRINIKRPVMYLTQNNMKYEVNVCDRGFGPYIDFATMSKVQDLRCTDEKAK